MECKKPTLNCGCLPSESLHEWTSPQRFCERTCLLQPLAGDLPTTSGAKTGTAPPRTERRSKWAAPTEEGRDAKDFEPGPRRLRVKAHLPLINQVEHRWVLEDAPELPWHCLVTRSSCNAKHDNEDGTATTPRMTERAPRRRSLRRHLSHEAPFHVRRRVVIVPELDEDECSIFRRVFHH
mmetsp:Transcript_45534/g.120838  ORF Transcript_45534/g.120838 Transcript_45534/m.120838 type:complete len:180 (-) Transcript_45534:2250-2789(-)